MKRLERFFLFACFGLLLVCTCDWWIAGTAQNALTPAESRGKQIYLRGTSPSGKEILAYVGDSSLEVPGNALPCANCHGLDGIGKPEGGINPTNLTWDALTKPYGVATPLGRSHPPYTDRALELALTRGVDPAGNKLSSVMPRYALLREDLSDLIAYLHRLGKDTDPGITENGLVIGTILPRKGPLTEMGDAIKAMTSAFFDELNSQGGIYNRRIELKFVEAGETSTATRANVERFLVNERPFAMTGAFIAGSENEILPLMSEKEIPLVGPVTLYPRTGFPLNRQVFYLLSGINEQARALVDFAAAKPELKNAGVGVVYAQNPTNSTVTEAIKDQAKKRGLATPQIYSYQPGAFDVAETGKQLYRTHPGAIFFIGNGEDLMRLMTTAEKSDPVPDIFLPGTVSADVFAAPAAFDGKIFISFPTSPTDQTEDGKKEFRVLAAKYQLPAKHLAVQLSVYSAAKILTEALKRTGRDLNRERLIRSLEGFSEYSTGLTPSISYGPNRRIGASGAYVITIDLKNQQYSPVSDWISIN